MMVKGCIRDVDGGIPRILSKEMKEWRWWLIPGLDWWTLQGWSRVEYFSRDVLIPFSPSRLLRSQERMRFQSSPVRRIWKKLLDQKIGQHKKFGILSVCLRLPLYLSSCLISASLYLSVCVSFCVWGLKYCVCASVYLTFCLALSRRASICLFVCLSVSAFIHFPSIQLRAKKSYTIQK